MSGICLFVAKDLGLTAIAVQDIKGGYSFHPLAVFLEVSKACNNKLLGFFVGQIMKKTEGKANPKIVNEILMKALE